MKMVINDDNDDKTYCHFKATKPTRFSGDNEEHMANKIYIYIYIYIEREREREREELWETQHWTTAGENCNCPERDLNPRPPDH